MTRTLAQVLAGGLILGTLISGATSAQNHETHPVRRVVAVGLIPPTAAVAVDYRTDRVFALSIVESTLDVLNARSGALLHTQGVNISSPEIAVDETSGHIFVPSAISNTVDMRNGTTGRLLRSIVLPQRPVAVIPTGARGRVLIVIGTPTPNGGSIRPQAQIAVLDGQSGRLVRTTPLSVPGGGLSAAVIDAPRRHVLLATGMTISIVDAVSGAVLHVAQTPRYISALVIDGRTDAIFAIGAGAAVRGHVVRQAVLYSVDSRTGAIAGTRSLGNVILVAATAAIDERTRRLFIASGLEAVGATGFGGGVVVRDIDTGAAIRTAVPGPSVMALALARQTGRVFVINAFAATQMLDARTGAVLRTITKPDQAQAIAVDERTNRTFIATTLAVHVLDARTGAAVQTTQVQ